MILFKIYTEDVDREKIERICSEELESFTITTGTGYWHYRRENCIVIDVVGREADRKAVLKTASRIKTKNNQESVMVVETVADHVFYIGKQGIHSGR